MIAWRIAVALLGIGVAILAIARNDRRIAWVAIGVLAVALLLRFIARRRAS
ncbi:MAG: hypothetical protein ACREL5_01205 [Gemmatimonadales bacterium]